MKISVIVATMNARNQLPRVIASYHEQTWKYKELLIADGGSNDGTLSFLQNNSEAIDWSISAPDKGFADAWNRCIQHATGDWLYFMGADDMFAGPDVLEKVARHLSKDNNVGKIVYGKVEMVRKDGSEAAIIGDPWNPARFREVCMSIPHQGTFHHRSLFQEYGLFATTDRSTPTYEMLLRYLCNHNASYMPDVVVGKMELGGISSQPWNQLKFYLAYVEAQRIHGTFRFNTELVLRVIQGIIKRIIFRICGPKAVYKFTDLTRILSGKEKLT